MSTTCSPKELYSAHIMVKDINFKNQRETDEMDMTIRDCMNAERAMCALLKRARDDLFRNRLKVILCKYVATMVFDSMQPTELNGSETEQLQKLAKAAGCPKITTWLE